MHTVIYIKEIAQIPAHYEVGFWERTDGRTETYTSFWHNVKAFPNAQAAYRFCNYLNGGTELSIQFLADYLDEEAE